MRIVKPGILPAAILWSAFATQPVKAFTEEKGSGYPQTKKETNIERHFGILYQDPFRWMENLHDPDLSSWVAAQNSLTGRFNAGKTLEQLKAEFREIFLKEDKSSVGRVLRVDRHQKFLERVRPDSTLDSSFDSSMSADGKYQIVLHSDSGSDLKTVTIRENDSGRILEDVLQVKFADFIWEASGNSFIYAGDQDGRTGYHFPTIRRHILGQKQVQDRVLFTAPTQDTWVSLTRVEDRFLLYQSRGDHNQWNEFDLERGVAGEQLLASDSELTPITDYKGEVFFLSFDQASFGKIVAVNLNTRTSRELVSEKNIAIDRTSRTGDDLFITYVEDTSNSLYHLNLPSGIVKRVNFSGVGSLVPSERDGKPYFYFTSYSQPTSGWVLDPKSNSLVLSQEAEPAQLDLETFRLFYRSHSGRDVPVWIIKSKDTRLSRSTPVYLYGYGGFRINIMPGYVEQYLPWLKRGGVVAVATLPGGLEYGENWHKAGAGFNKMRVFEDFARAARQLMARGISSREKLAIGGGSNGGLLVGATVNEYPGLFKAAVPEVGVMEMTRFELYTGGKWWTSEYGSRKNPREFRNLMRVSPYHNIRSARYPHILTMTANLDDRVVASHSYKYTAMLQSWNFPHQVSLLYTKMNGSHSSRSGSEEEMIDYYAHKWAFLLKTLNVR